MPPVQRETVDLLIMSVFSTRGLLVVPASSSVTLSRRTRFVCDLNGFESQVFAQIPDLEFFEASLCYRVSVLYSSVNKTGSRDPSSPADFVALLCREESYVSCTSMEYDSTQ